MASSSIPDKFALIVGSMSDHSLLSLEVSELHLRCHSPVFAARLDDPKKFCATNRVLRVREGKPETWLLYLSIIDQAPAHATLRVKMGNIVELATLCKRFKCEESARSAVRELTGGDAMSGKVLEEPEQACCIGWIFRLEPLFRASWRALVVRTSGSAVGGLVVHRAYDASAGDAWLKKMRRRPLNEEILYKDAENIPISSQGSLMKFMCDANIDVADLRDAIESLRSELFETSQVFVNYAVRDYPCKLPHPHGAKCKQDKAGGFACLLDRAEILVDVNLQAPVRIELGDE